MPTARDMKLRVCRKWANIGKEYGNVNVDVSALAILRKKGQLYLDISYLGVVYLMPDSIIWQANTGYETTQAI